MNSNARLVLEGIKVIEFAGLAPGPFCGKILADFGASVIRIDKPNSGNLDWLSSNKKSIILNIKKPSSVDIVKKLCCTSDVLLDTYRPGVLERLGLGPIDVMTINPKLIYARLSGFGQVGPLSQAAGHDINYVALSGILSQLGRKEAVPTPPVNLLADFAGGGLLCAFGIVLSLYNRILSGKGEVIDLSMAEGAAYVSSFLYSSKNSYIWSQPRGQNILDSGAHFYDTYETKDGKYMAIGSIEPPFYENLMQGLQLDSSTINHMTDFDENKIVISKKFKERTQEEWVKVFDCLDACVTPVLSLEEAPFHPHNKERQNFRKVKDHWEPTVAPRFTDMFGNLTETSKKSMEHDPPCPLAGEHSIQVLEELGYSSEIIKSFINEGAVHSIDSKL